MILIALCTMPGTPSQGWSLRLYLLTFNSILLCEYCIDIVLMFPEGLYHVVTTQLSKCHLVDVPDYFRKKF